MPTLKKFEGRDVVGAAMKITRAGDGLSEALELAPEVFKPGEKVTLVLEGVVADVVYKQVPKTEAMKRVHVLRTERIVKIPAADAQGYFVAEAERLSKLRDEAEGVTRLPLGDDPLGVFGGSSAPVEPDEPNGDVATG
jgi:hypothetical protein